MGVNPWTANDIPDQTGRVYVVTGASSGLGLVTARELARKGAYVVMAVRDVDKGEQARKSVPGGDDHSEVRLLDVSDLASVREFAEQLSDWRIDVLINNAGIANTPLERTAEGFESQFATNVLGPFLLTSLLLPRLTDRVVWVSSIAHRLGNLDLEDLNWENRRYQGLRAYGATKLADLVLAYEMQRRFVRTGSPLRSMAAHPGLAQTDLGQDTGSPLEGVAKWLNTLPTMGQSAEHGALPLLYAATVPDLAGGSYIGPDGFGERRGHPRPVGSSASSHHRAQADELWAACERLTGSGPVLD